MLALYAMGRAHEALEAYRRLRSVLVGELGLEPSVETRALEAAILRQDEAAELLPRPAREIELRAPGQPWMLFLGRKPELTALEELVRSALGGEFSLVFVEGEAGLGKSRLLEEFASTLDGVRVGRAKCSALEQRLAYVPLAGALRDALSGVELDLAQLPALRGILPELGMRQPAMEFGEVDVLEAIVALITRHAPMILILDDLHLADSGTIAALEYLHRRCAKSPVVVLGAMRGEDTASDHPLRGLPATEIRLEPLTGDELSPLGIPGVHERTGGHPALVADLIANGSRPDLRRSLAELLTARCRGGYRGVPHPVDGGDAPAAVRSRGARRPARGRSRRADRATRATLRSPHPPHRRLSLSVSLRDRPRRSCGERVTRAGAVASRARRDGPRASRDLRCRWT